MSESGKDDRELFRRDLHDRISERKGDVRRAARILGVAESTVTRWGREKNHAGGPEKFPDVWQILRIALDRDVSPAWLAYGLGPKEPDSAWEATPLEVPEAELHLAQRIAELDKADRKLLETLLGKLEPAPAGPAEAIMGRPIGARDDKRDLCVSDKLLTAEDVQEIRKVVLDRLVRMADEDPAYEPLDRVDGLLSVLIDQLKSSRDKGTSPSDKKTAPRERESLQSGRRGASKSDHTR